MYAFERKVHRSGQSGTRNPVLFRNRCEVSQLRRVPIVGLRGVDNFRFALTSFTHDFNQIPLYPGKKDALQSKKTGNDPADSYEQEAENMAGKVVSGKYNAIDSNSVTHLRSGDNLRRENAPHTQAQTLEPGTGPAFWHTLHTARRSGQPLEEKTRTSMERAFGFNFSNVRIHTDETADLLGRSIHARAFATGREIFFRRNEANFVTRTGRELLAHELTHVIQQQRNRLPDNSFFPVIQKGNSTPGTASRRVRGTPHDVMFYIWNPGMESKPGLKAAINLLDRYLPHVTRMAVDIRLRPASARSRISGLNLRFGGDSQWEGNIPVVRLPQAAMDVIAQHEKGKSKIEDVHEVIRTIGHEMYHLWRAKKERHSKNPVMPVYEAEAIKRMQTVRQNWIIAIQRGASQIQGVPRTIKRWREIPGSHRKRIEKEATGTDYIQGLYNRSAYIVEEIYAKIEELSFLKIQKQHETGQGATPSRTGMEEVAETIFFLKNNMDDQASLNQLITPQLWKRAQREMLAYLRRRYPNRQNPGKDSFEVLFYLDAMYTGTPPVFSGGRLISTPPPGARVPARIRVP